MPDIVRWKILYIHITNLEQMHIYKNTNTDDEKYKIQCKYNNRKLRDVGNEAGELIRWLAKLCRGRRRAPP